MNEVPSQKFMLHVCNKHTEQHKIAVYFLFLYFPKENILCILCRRTIVLVSVCVATVLSQTSLKKT
jgi:hypothetical protein